MTDFRTCRIKQLLLPPPCLSNELNTPLLLAHSIEGRGYRQVITEHNWDIWGVGCDVTIYSRLSDEKTNFLFCVSEWNNFLVCNINHSCSCFRIKKNRLSSRFPVEHILRRFRCTTFKINISGFFLFQFMQEIEFASNGQGQAMRNALKMSWILRSES